MDDLARAAKLIVDKFAWPIDLSKDHSVSGGNLLALRNALRSREMVNLWEVALEYECPKCHALPGKPCMTNFGMPVSSPHKQRMRQKCKCGHAMYNHRKNGQCTFIQRGTKMCHCQRFEKSS